MRIAQVIGTVTLSRMHPSLVGGSFRLAVPLSLANLRSSSTERAEALVVFDQWGAGQESLIALSEGTEAAQPLEPRVVPIDAYNAAILDRLDLFPENARTN